MVMKFLPSAEIISGANTNDGQDVVGLRPYRTHRAQPASQSAGLVVVGEERGKKGGAILFIGLL